MSVAGPSEQCYSKEKEMRNSRWGGIRTPTTFALGEEVTLPQKEKRSQWYSPTSESEEAHLIVPFHERQEILKTRHDTTNADPYRADGTFESISKWYYWTVMRSYINDFVKNCTECNLYKPSNQKPSVLFRTPSYSQRFETIYIDLFGPLPKGPFGKKRLISDNGSKFVDAVIKQLCFILNIDQDIIPVYHPQANPVERKNRDLKPRIDILVQNRHSEWVDKLPSIYFVLKRAKFDTNGKTTAYLQFRGEIRTIDDVINDCPAIIDNENFVPEITLYLKRLARISSEIRERVEEKPDQRNTFCDKRHRPSPLYHPRINVWVTVHPLSNASQNKTAKFMRKRDGPYIIVTQRSPTIYEGANPNNPHEVLGPYHSFALCPCIDKEATLVMQLRKGGRPRKDNSADSSLMMMPRNQKRSVTNGKKDNRECLHLAVWTLNQSACHLGEERTCQCPSAQTPLLFVYY
ncbi:integrase catalytic domain-containing protein [Trichonephila clavipes]|nr:integrase catalytic domain-containing protein [Trichonephila clavipes]